MVAAANQDGGTDAAYRLKGFRVAYDDLAAVASGAKGEPIDVLDQARAQVSAAKLQSGAFGPSGEANGIVKYWNEALDQRYTEIGTCMNVIADMADKLQHNVDNYIATEEKNDWAVKKSREQAGDKVNEAPGELSHDYPSLAHPDIK